MSFPITGTLINAATVIGGGALGTLLGNRLPEKMRQTVLHGLGLMTLVVGISMAITTRNILIPLFSVLIGSIIGEALGIENALERLGQWVESRPARRYRRDQLSRKASSLRAWFSASGP
jgi:uncharacterized membrane protein YqgA involved in biofilm formation